MRMRWLDLLFAHWPVPVETLRPLIPAGLEVDTFEGRAWLGIVPFRMEDVAPAVPAGRAGSGRLPGAQRADLRPPARPGRGSGS